MLQRILSIAGLSLFITVSATRAQDAAKGDGAKAFDFFAGVWLTQATDKPAKWTPQEQKRSLKEVAVRILKGRCLLSREVTEPGDAKSLWIMAHDPKTGEYPFWIFNNKGLYGAEWRNTWNDSAKTFSGKATDTPAGWTSGGINRFVDKNTNHVTFWMKDEKGTLLMDGEAKKARQPDAAAEKILTEWSKVEKPASLPVELKVLERLAGSWDVAAVSRPAEWTPKEVRTTSKVERKWVLDGHFLQDTSEVSDGHEGYSLLTFDPQKKAYRSWWFSSEGYHNKSEGQWDAAAATMSMKAEFDNGLVGRSSLRFQGDDQHVWTVQIKDAAGKLYFDGEWTVTRRK